jgi:hypothetical protein
MHKKEYIKTIKKTILKGCKNIVSINVIKINVIAYFENKKKTKLYLFKQYPKQLAF